jgi:hypothetical protein
VPAGVDKQQDVGNLCGSMHSAAWHGNTEVLQKLLTEGTSVDVADKYGCTALHWAARQGQTGVVQQLLSAGASVNAVNRFGCTALHSAVRQGHIGVVQQLLAAGASVDAADQYSFTPLHSAAWKGHIRVVQELIAAGASVNAQHRYGYTALHSAARHGHAKVVQMLLSCCAFTVRDMASAADIAAVAGHASVGTDVLKVLMAQDMNAAASVLSSCQELGAEVLRQWHHATTQDPDKDLAVERAALQQLYIGVAQAHAQLTADSRQKGARRA